MATAIEIEMVATARLRIETIDKRQPKAAVRLAKNLSIHGRLRANPGPINRGKP
jgi:hypothetical protein